MIARARTVLFVALRQLWARKGLNGTAVLGVVLGVVTLITVDGMMKGFEEKFLSSILKANPHVTIRDEALASEPRIEAVRARGPVVVRVAGERPSDRERRIDRPEELVDEVARVPGVVAASASIVGSALVTLGAKERPVELRGIDPAAQDRVTPMAADVTDGSLAALAASPHGIVVGSGVAKRLGAHVGDHVTCRGPSGAHDELEIVGVYVSGVPPIDDARAFVKLRLAQTILGRPDMVDRVEIRLRDPERAVGVAARLGRALSHETKSWQEENKNLLALLEEQDEIVAFVVASILAVGGFGILAIQIMIVAQKTKDIAILRSYGFRRGEILVLFLVQGLVVAFLGALLGDVLGHYAIVALSHVRFHEEDFVKSDTFLVYDDARFYVYGLVFSMIVAAVASVMPARRAARVEPVDVLRGLVG